jgi:hypothetical protein
MGRIRTIYNLYMIGAFMAPIPVSCYYIFREGLPKRILLLCIPAYAFLAYGRYRKFRQDSQSR